MKEYFSDEKNTQFQKQAQKFVDKQNKKDQNKKSPPLYLANAKNKRPLGSSLGVVALFLTATFVLFMVISSYWENNHISDAPYPLQPQEASNPPSVHLLDTVQAAETFSDTLYKLPLALDNIPVPEPEPDIELDTEQVLEPQDEEDDIVEANVEDKAVAGLEPENKEEQKTETEQKKEPEPKKDPDPQIIIVPDPAPLNPAMINNTDAASFTEEPIIATTATVPGVVIKGLEYDIGLTKLDLSRSGITDADLGSLARMSNLQWLSLEGNSISNISALSGLTSLTYLNLAANRVSDISAIRGLGSLGILMLENNQIADISALSGLTSLRRLSLGNNKLSDISALSGLRNLTYLALEDNQVSNISSIRGATNLQTLHLSNLRISDIGALEGLSNLEVLMLNNDQITDLTPLMGLKKLSYLHIMYTNVSQDNVERFRAALPGCNVSYK